jgi:hypothetical protein
VKALSRKQMPSRGDDTLATALFMLHCTQNRIPDAFFD